jgi:hypothetical protein
LAHRCLQKSHAKPQSGKESWLFWVEWDYGAPGAAFGVPRFARRSSRWIWQSIWSHFLPKSEDPERICFSLLLGGFA